jgi:hypothetical protein
VANARFDTTTCYGRHGADAMIRCTACQHTTRASSSDLTIMFPIPAGLSSAIKRLRCAYYGLRAA